ncbi:MAG: hypothetical protein SPE24_09045 [Erysipelotrichaceae bacterium]|nr:hypothetical protein [Erysipelotrichaceae bacterium]
MKFDYGTQLSPYPIVLSIGTLIKPKLQRVADLSFDKFNYYEVLIKMSPETFYTKIKGGEGLEYWNSLSEEEQDNLTLYDVVINDKQLTDTFVEIFNFFFEEKVIFREGYFVLLNKSIDGDSDITSKEDIRGVISKNIFPQVLNVIQQVCCINDNEENIDDMKFKNALARKLYEKMQKAAKKQKEEKKGNVDFTLPNIISSVSNKHPTISPTSVWELTIFQLLDSFNRMQINSMFDIDSTRVSVWGDEKKTFNAALWYKNEYDKK